MNREEAKKLVDKCLRVIVSCKTNDQLNNAVRYAGFTYDLLAKEIGLINNMNFITLIERSIGYAQCNINKRHQTEVPGEWK